MKKFLLIFFGFIFSHCTALISASPETSDADVPSQRSSSSSESDASTKSDVSSSAGKTAAGAKKPLEAADDESSEEEESLTPSIPKKKQEYYGFTLPPGARPIISMCPINSSGDIYHILAYIILCQSQGKDVPPVCLTYDGKEEFITIAETNTYTQVQRSIGFVKMLGYDDIFSTLYLDSYKGKEKVVGRQNSRQTTLRQALKTDPQYAPYTHYIDQKALTLIIADAFVSDRSETITALKRGFSQDALDHSTLTQIDSAVSDEFEKIKSHANGAPSVILQGRHSGKTNSDQNFQEGILVVRDFLLSQNIPVWCIFSDGRGMRYSFPEMKGHRTNPFPHTIDKIDKVDYGKLFHLRLLLKLTTLDKVRVVGNTSGTLDLAAFVGHNVYNLHQFKNDINYQGARILMQSAFMTIEFIVSETLDDLKAWLRKETKPAIPFKKSAAFAKISAALVKESTTDFYAGFKELFYIMRIQDSSLMLLPQVGSLQTYLGNTLSFQ